MVHSVNVSRCTPRIVGSGSTYIVATCRPKREQDGTEGVPIRETRRGLHDVFRASGVAKVEDLGEGPAS